jgi:excisionase family DNA binding protein
MKRTPVIKVPAPPSAAATAAGERLETDRLRARELAGELVDVFFDALVAAADYRAEFQRLLGDDHTGTDGGREEDRPSLLRVPEFARQVQLSRSTIYELIERNELPVVRYGTAVRIPATAVAEFVAARLNGNDTQK